MRGHIFFDLPLPGRIAVGPAPERRSGLPHSASRHSGGKDCHPPQQKPRRSGGTDPRRGPPAGGPQTGEGSEQGGADSRSTQNTLRDKAVAAHRNHVATDSEAEGPGLHIGTGQVRPVSTNYNYTQPTTTPIVGREIA